MADLDILPTWAVNHLMDHVADHAHIINALPLEGAWRGGYLINTSLGAMVLHKRRGGEPRHWLLPLPGRRSGFSCHVCQERMEFVDPALPRDAYCAQCGAKYQLAMENGSLAVRRGDAKAVSAGFRHAGHTLYKRNQGGQDVYFFAKGTPKTGEPASKPEGFKVSVHATTGLPVLEPEGPKRCAGVTAAGKPCRLKATAGSDRCHRHQGGPRKK